MVLGSQSLIEAIYDQDIRDYAIIAEITNFSGTTTYYSLHNADIAFGGLTLESSVCVDGEFPTGKCIMKKMMLTLRNASTYDGFQFAKKWVHLGIGYPNPDINFGRFRIDSVEYSGEEITLNCYDMAYRFDAQFTGVTTPITAYNLLESIKTMCGWSSSANVFYLTSAQRTELQGVTYYSIPTGEDLTCRNILDYMMETLGYNMRYDNQAGWFVLVPYDVRVLENITPTNEYTAQQNGYDLFRYPYSLDISHTDVMVNGMYVVYNDPSATELVNKMGYAPTDLLGLYPDFTLWVENNPLTTADNAYAIATILHSKYDGMQFRRANFTHVEDPRIEAGDIGLLLGTDGVYHPIIVSYTKFQMQNRQSITSSVRDAKRSGTNGYSEKTKTVNEAYNYSKTHSDANATLIATLQTDVGNVGTRVTALESEDFWYVQRCSYEYTCPASGSVNVTKNQLDVSIPTGFTIIGYTSISTANADVVPRSWNAQATATGTSIVLRNLTSSQKTGTLTVDVLSMKTSRQQP